MDYCTDTGKFYIRVKLPRTIGENGFRDITSNSKILQCLSVLLINQALGLECYYLH